MKLELDLTLSRSSLADLLSTLLRQEEIELELQILHFEAEGDSLMVYAVGPGIALAFAIKPEDKKDLETLHREVLAVAPPAGPTL